MIAIGPWPIVKRLPAVLALSTRGAYNSTDGVLSNITREWERTGTRVIWHDLAEPNWEKRLLDDIATYQVRLCIAAGFGGRLRFENDNLWEHFRIPFFSVLYDHPAYFGARHHHLPRCVTLAYEYRDHALYQRDHVKSANLIISFDLGLASLSGQPPRTDRSVPTQVIFAKTGNNPRELETKWAARPAIARILHDVLDEVGLQNCGVFPAAVEKVASAHRLELQPFDKLTRFLIAQVDDYIRRRKSTAIAEAIKKYPIERHRRKLGPHFPRRRPRALSQRLGLFHVPA